MVGLHVLQTTKLLCLQDIIPAMQPQFAVLLFFHSHAVQGGLAPVCCKLSCYVCFGFSYFHGVIQTGTGSPELSSFNYHVDWMFKQNLLDM